MPSLSFKDVRALNAAFLQLHGTPSVEAFSGEINNALRTLITGEICCVNWIDRRTKTALSTVYHPAAPVPEEVNLLAQTLLSAQAPFWLHSAREPSAASDFMSWSEWSRKDIHWACRQVAKEEFITFDVHLTSKLMLTLAEMRGSYGRYSPEERLKLKLLGAHLPQIYQRLAAQTGMALGSYRIVQVAKAHLTQGGQRCEWTAGARKLLAGYRLAPRGDQLPAPIKEWFLAQKRALEKPSEVSPGITPLHFCRGGREIAIFLMRGSMPETYRLLLQEREAVAVSSAAVPGLTPREQEVLSWVAQGKSNPEIAIILGLSPGTVRRHLENIFPKLGVENRYAAGLMASKLFEGNHALIPQD